MKLTEGNSYDGSFRELARAITEVEEKVAKLEQKIKTAPPSTPAQSSCTCWAEYNGQPYHDKKCPAASRRETTR